MANKYWHVLHCCRPQDKKSTQIYFFLYNTHYSITIPQLLWFCPLTFTRSLFWVSELLDSIESKVNQFDIVNNFQYSFDMIFGLVPLPDRPVSQSEQLSVVWTLWSPASSILDHWALHTGAAPYSHLLPHFFPLCGANYVSDTRHVHLVDTLAKVDTAQIKGAAQIIIFLWSGLCPLGCDEILLNSLDLDQAWVIKQNL